MPRPTGSKVIKCKKCGSDVVARPEEKGTCKHCGTKVTFSLRLLKSLGKL